MSNHEIVSGSQKVSAVKKGSRPDVQSLLLHTPHHPDGRISIDPTTGLVRNPKNNVLFSKKLKIKVDGTIIGERDVNVNGGHVKKEGSVWRIPLNGPSRYHWKVMQDDYRFTYQNRADRTAPILTGEEAEEYQFFRSFLAETKTVVKEGVFDETDKVFYAWLKKQDKSKIQLVPLVSPPQNVSVDPPVR